MSMKLVTPDRDQSDREALASSPLAIRGLTVSYAEKPAVFSVDATFQPEI